MERLVDKLEQIAKFFAVWRRFRRRLRTPLFRRGVWKVWWRILRSQKATKVCWEAIIFFVLTVIFLVNGILMALRGDGFAKVEFLFALVALVALLSSLGRLADPLAEADKVVADIVRKQRRRADEAAAAAAEELATNGPAPHEPNIPRRRRRY